MYQHDFHDFFFSLSAKDRAAYADKVGTTVGYLEKVAFGGAAPSLSMLQRMMSADRRVTFDGIYNTWSNRQAKLRERRHGKACRLAQ